VRRRHRRCRLCRRAAAAQFLRKGLKVVLIDKNIIGGSSSGRSAGFLTPDSELELHQLCRRYGNDAAREIWDAPCRGIEVIVNSIREHDIQCGLLKQDSLFLGRARAATTRAKAELECRKERRIHGPGALRRRAAQGHPGPEGYTAGIRYGGTYGINPLQCLQGFKDVLVDNGMQVFEAPR
jgi:gamma-glutamylputrescine oxidase